MKWKEALTQQKNTNMLLWIKFWMILLVLHEGYGLDQPYKEVKGTTCQEIVKQPNYQARLNCNGKDVKYHCLLDDVYTMEYEVCREWKWIPKGKCAYFNTYGSGNVDERDCKSIPGLPCAVKEYNSADNTNYAACYMKKEMTTVPILETRVVNSSTGENSSLGQTPPTNSIQDEQSHPGSALGITFGVLIPIILAVAAAVLLLKYGKILEHCRKGSKENIDIEGHPCANAKLMENNEEGKKKDENERNESKGNTPPLENESNPTEEDKLLECNEEEYKQNVEYKSKEDKTSTKTSEIADSHSGSSNPNSEEALTQNTQENQGNECSDTESTPVNGSSEIPVQADDDMQGKKEVSIDSGESKLSSTTQGTVEKKENESTEKDENQSNETGNKDIDVKLHAMDNREDSLIPEQVISTSNQTQRSDINNENSGNSKDGNIMSNCFTGGSEKEQADSSEHKSDEKDSKKVINAEDSGGSVNSIQNNLENENSVDPSINLTEASVDQDENLDACKPNPDSILKTDDKEETSSEEEEDTGGVFDDTLDSLKIKDDKEKGGSQELHEFLDEVSTRLAKKILYRVLKYHVTEPQSYLNDESKITSVKELLPSEYQASVSIDSNDKKSISVIYAILQLSLDKKHQPKSGWGQVVKDTDTGVGDDAERLYRVHTLCREIANPEQVSLAGYIRLCRSLFGAVDRLDEKGWCKEDYQEFIKKWENLQRNLWFKDNLKALQSLIKKWSLTSSATD